MCGVCFQKLEAAIEAVRKLDEMNKKLMDSAKVVCIVSRLQLIGAVYYFGREEIVSLRDSLLSGVSEQTASAVLQF